MAARRCRLSTTPWPAAKYLQDVLARGLKDQTAAVAVRRDRGPGPDRRRQEPHARRRRRVSAAGQGPELSGSPRAVPGRHHAGQGPARGEVHRHGPGGPGAERGPASDRHRPLLWSWRRETRNTLKAAIRAAGYEVVEEAEREEGHDFARRTSGVDVVVLADSPTRPRSSRRCGRTRCTRPAVAVVKANSAAAARSRRPTRAS